MPPLALLGPRHWPTWLLVLLFATLALLPWPVLFSLGRLAGQIALRLAHRRRGIAIANLARCFPELSTTQRKKVLVEHFEALGIGLVETALSLWAPDRRFRRRVHFEGAENLQRATQSGRGVILVGAHFTTMELSIRLMSMHHPIFAVYRPHENPVIDYVMRTRRSAHYGLIQNGDMRTMLRSLRHGATIWFAPDQAYFGPRGVDVPFFSIPAPTSTGTSRLAATSGAIVLPFFFKRRANGHYQLKILSPLEDFPSADDVADAERVNLVLEQGIREAVAQYLWSHDRFKQFRRLYEHSD